MRLKRLVRDGHTSFELLPPKGPPLRADLRLARLETRFRVYGNPGPKGDGLPERGDFAGRLGHRSVLSFLNAVRLSPPQTYGGPAIYYPQWVAVGGRALTREDRIAEVSFSTPDAVTLFYDWRAFGTESLTPEAADVRLGGADRAGTGRGAELAWFSGETDVCDVETAMGRFTARNLVLADPGGTRGARVRSRIFLTLAFAPAVDFETAMRRVHAVRRFLEVLAGRRQRLKRVSLKPEGAGASGLDHLELYVCGDAKDPEDRRSRAHVTSLPLTNVLEGEAFPKVMANWLAVDAGRLTARARFRTSFVQGESFSPDRLVAAANMFDLLPADAGPATVEIGDDLAAAVEAARADFKSLPDSFERQSVLGALGRVGKPALKHKVLHCARQIVQRGGHMLPELAFVLSEAVDARNLYVHGTLPKRRTAALFDANSIFLTEALEFAFACSELVEAGWNFGAWLHKVRSADHVFSRFVRFYGEALADYKAAVAAAAR